MAAQFTKLTARMAVLPADDVDTDQIIPARFLTTTDKVGLGKHLFSDWRYLPDGSPKADFVLNRPEVEGAQVLVAGRNFGCGSSREHAPWSLCGWGFRAVVARSFADIFRQNALKNGLVPVEVDADTHAALVASWTKDPAALVTVDLERSVLVLPDGREVAFAIDPFARRCLTAGLDELSYLLSHEAKIAAHEARMAASEAAP